MKNKSVAIKSRAIKSNSKDMESKKTKQKSKDVVPVERKSENKNNVETDLQEETNRRGAKTKKKANKNSKNSLVAARTVKTNPSVRLADKSVIGDVKSKHEYTKKKAPMTVSKTKETCSKESREVLDERSSSKMTIKKRNNPKPAQPKRTAEKEGAPEKSENIANVMKGFGRTVKRFVSKPIEEKKIRNLAEKVQAKTAAMRNGVVKFGEDVFPHKNTKTIEEPLSSAYIELGDEVTAECQEVDETAPTTLSSFAAKNNENDGKLFIKGIPFWFQPNCREPKDEDLVGVAEDREFNAEVVMQVNEGTLKLKCMPSVPVALDAYEEVDKMARKDAMFFNQDVVFGNTVRSMINTYECSQKIVRDSKSAKVQERSMTEPTKCFTYIRRKNVFDEKPFVPGEKAKELESRKKKKKTAKRAKESMN